MLAIKLKFLSRRKQQLKVGEEEDDEEKKEKYKKWSFVCSKSAICQVNELFDCKCLCVI